MYIVFIHSVYAHTCVLYSHFLHYSFTSEKILILHLSTCHKCPITLLVLGLTLYKTNKSPWKI